LLIKNYLELTGQVDGNGRKISSNTEASGRFHTDWLNMMYPRLKLARNLLREDGVIFINIDDNEVDNITAILKEILGPENFAANFIWEKRRSRENRKLFSVNHDYIVCATKTKSAFETVRGLLPLTDEARNRIKNADERRPVRTRQAVLHSEEFQALWNRIKHKTTYRVRFDNEKLVADCAEAIRKCPPVTKTRVQIRKADLAIGRGGVSSKKTTVAAPSGVIPCFLQPKISCLVTISRHSTTQFKRIRQSKKGKSELC
jgi:hypothetical protein